MSEHWTETAWRVTDGDPRIVGEDEHGDLYVPARGGHLPVWDRRLNLRNPLHWSYYLRSRRQGRIAFLERIDPAQ